MNILDNMIVGSMRKTYADAVSYFGFGEADKVMSQKYGELYWSNKEEIWQWYDDNSKFDEDIVCINRGVK